MIRIAIVDDEVDQIQKIQEIVLQFFEDQKLAPIINMFTSGEALLSTVASYDLIFLDIQMHGLDGIETAQKIRKYDKKTALIYISNFSEKISASFIVHPFAFIEKPIQPAAIRKNLQDYLAYQKSMHEKNRIFLPGPHGKISVDVQDILYFEYEANRKIRLVTTNANYCIAGSISELFNLMKPYDFISPHKSFIVNEAKIRSFYVSLVMENGDEIPIAKNRQKQVKEQINAYLHHHLLD